MSSERKLFGEVAFERGFLTSEQLYEGLAAQAKIEARNEPYKFLGEILIGLGYLTEKQVLEVLRELHGPEKSGEKGGGADDGGGRKRRLREPVR
jgi:hypothetical protein